MKGELGAFFGDRIEFVDIEPQVLIAGVEDVIAKPYGPLVAAGKGGEAVRGVFFEVVQPQISCPATFVAFPGAKFTVNRCECNFACIGRQACKTTVDNGQFFFKTTV